MVNKYSEIKLEGKARQSVIDSVSFSGIETITNKLDRVEKIFPNRVLGFDISHHNKFPSKETLEKYNLKFVFIKATEGANLVDKSLMENVLKAKESGLQYSIYHFFQPNDPVVEQAKNFNTAYKKVRCSLPLMIDVEWADFNNKKNVHYNGLTDSLLNFISLLNAPNKEKIIIYTAPPFAKQYLDNRLSKYQVCLAGVGKNFNPAIGVTNLWNKIKYWQFYFAEQGDLNIDLIASSGEPEN